MSAKNHCKIKVHTILVCTLYSIKYGKLEKSRINTDSSSCVQIARAVRRRTSLPSRRMRSQTLRTVSLGRQVEKRVRNHCIVNTLVRGGS